MTITLITAHELHEQTQAILRRVREQGETIEVVDQGTIVARLVPPEPRDVELEQLATIWAERDRLAEEIGKHWPEGVSAVEAVRDVRRDR